MGICKIKEEWNTPRSYVAETSDKKSFRRNHGSPMKLCKAIVLLEVHQITLKIFRNLSCDITMTSLLKMENSDLRETRPIIYHSKGNDKSFPKM